MMDDLADRAPLFAAFFIAPNRDRVQKMVHIEAVRISNCEGLRNGSGCLEMVKLIEFKHAICITF